MATANEPVLLEEDDESGSDMEFGEFGLSGARNFRDQQTVAGYEDDEWASEEEEDDESGSDMEFGEFDLSGARNLRGQRTVARYEDDDDDADGCGPQFSVRPYHRAGAIAGMMGNLQLSGFEARSDGPQLTDQHEVTSHDMRHLVHLALEGGASESMEGDEAYQRALAAGTPLSRVARDAMVGLALQQSANQQQQSKPPSETFPMRTGY